MKKASNNIFILLLIFISVLTSCKNTVPTVIIDKPVDNSSYIYGQSIEFSATVSDEEDGIISDDKIIWTSDKDGEIGKGKSFSKSNLSVNNHTIKVTATDSKSQTTEKSIFLEITGNEFTFGTITPANNGTFFEKDTILFSCSPDFGNGNEIDPTKIKWISDKDGEIGTGLSFEDTLSANIHIITLSYEGFEDYNQQITLTVSENAFSFGIILPANESEFIESEEISFSCSPSFQNGSQIDPAKIKWNSNYDGEIGTGLSFSKNLSVNSHQITLSYEGNEIFNTQLNLTIVENTIDLNFVQLPSNQYYQNNSINFECTAVNFDGTNVNEENITWTSDKDGLIGTGTSFSVSNLSINEHQITIIAENEQDRTAELTFNLTIVANTVENFELLLTRMCGYFSSEAHADTTTNQYIVDVRLHMAQIWDDRNAGENIYWLYVEQAYADDLEHPYRQRIYKVIFDSDGTMRDEIYSLGYPVPAEFLHGYNNPEVFDDVDISQLTIKDGCGLFFAMNEENIFDGETVGTDCLATIPGLPQVKYITSVTTLADTYLTSWDRGYSQTGVWLLGPDWPYIFNKLENYPFVPSK